MGNISEEVLEEINAAINFAYNQIEHNDNTLSTHIDYDGGTVKITGPGTPVIIAPTDSGYIIRYGELEELFADKIEAAERSVELFAGKGET